MSETTDERVTLWRSRALWHRLMGAALGVGMLVAIAQALHGDVPWMLLR